MAPNIFWRLKSTHLQARILRESVLTTKRSEAALKSGDLLPYPQAVA